MSAFSSPAARSPQARTCLVAMAILFALPGVGAVAPAEATNACLLRPGHQEEETRSVTRLGTALVAALRDGSYEILEPHVATAEDFPEVLQVMVETGTMTEEQRNQLSSDIAAMAEEVRASARQSYGSLREHAAELELDWDAIELQYEVIWQGPEESAQRSYGAERADAELTAGEVTIVFDAADARQTISLGSCVRLGRGWVILGPLSWTSMREA